MHSCKQLQRVLITEYRLYFRSGDQVSQLVLIRATEPVDVLHLHRSLVRTLLALWNAGTFLPLFGRVACLPVYRQVTFRF